MVKKWTSPALILLTLAFAVSFRSDFIYFLLGFEVMVWLVGLAATFYLSKKITMRVELRQNRAFRHEPFQLCARILSKSRLPMPQVQCRLAIRCVPQMEEILLKGKVMMDSNEQGSLCFTMDSNHCGCLEVRADQLMITDYLGFFQRKCQIDDQERLTFFILPEILADPSSSLESKAFLQKEDGSDEKKGMTMVDPMDIRNYQVGDSMRMVHWKVTARVGDLMVRELMDSAEPMTWLYLNLQESSFEPQKKGRLKQEEELHRNAIRRNPDAWDHFIETVADVSASLLQQKKYHVAAWINPDHSSLEQYTVTDEESLQTMICSLLHTDTFQSQDYSALLKEIHSSENQDVFIEINLQGKVLYNKKELSN